MAQNQLITVSEAHWLTGGRYDEGGGQGGGAADGSGGHGCAVVFLVVSGQINPPASGKQISHARSCTS